MTPIGLTVFHGFDSDDLDADDNKDVRYDIVAGDSSVVSLNSWVVNLCLICYVGLRVSKDKY